MGLLSKEHKVNDNAFDFLSQKKLTIYNQQLIIKLKLGSRKKGNDFWIFC